jgi:hypothetical protein
MVLTAEQFQALGRLPADSVLETLQNAQAGAANGAAADLKGYRSASLQISGTFTGITANFEGTLDDANWSAVGLELATTGALATTATATGIYRVPASLAPALSQIRARTTAASPTGSMTVVSRKQPR